MTVAASQGLQTGLTRRPLVLGSQLWLCHMPAVVPNAQQSPSQLTLTGILPSGHYCSGWMGGWDTTGFSTLPEVASLVKRGSGCGTPLGRPGSADIPRGVFWASGPVALGPCQAWVSVCLLCSACPPSPHTTSYPWTDQITLVRLSHEGGLRLGGAWSTAPRGHRAGPSAGAGGTALQGTGKVHP